MSWALEMVMPFFILSGYVALYLVISTLFYFSPRYSERQASIYLSYFVNAACFVTMLGYVYMVWCFAACFSQQFVCVSGALCVT